MAPVHWAAGSDGETNLGATSLAAPNAASSSVARYSFVARLTACASSSLFHCEPGVDRCLLASATIRLASTAKPSPPTKPALMHAPTTRSNTLRKMPLSPFIAGPRKRRVIRDLVLQREPTKPAIGKVHSHITAKRPLRSDRKHVADDEHPDHQHRIDRWPTEPRIIRCQLGMHPTQIKNRSNLTDRMIIRHCLIKPK